MRFIHTSDLHLGYTQYGYTERLQDFARALNQIVDRAIEFECDFILIAGDLFHKRNINALTFLQAWDILAKLKAAGIKALAIEGNHDTAFYEDRHSWLRALEHQGLLRLIKTMPGVDEGMEIMGDYCDVDGARVFGLKYSGAKTVKQIPRIAKEIETINAIHGKPELTILMMHIGLRGTLPYAPELQMEMRAEEVFVLKDVVDYLALGHYHISYALDGWIYNGGCPELYSQKEYGYDSGYYVYDAGMVHLEKVDTRPVIKLDVKDYSGPESLCRSIETRLKKISSATARPMIFIDLESREEIDINELENQLSQFDPLFVKIRQKRRQDTALRTSIVLDEIEKSVFQSKVSADRRFSEHMDHVVDCIMDVKDLAVSSADVDTILDRLRSAFNEVSNDH